MFDAPRTTPRKLIAAALTSFGMLAMPSVPASKAVGVQSFKAISPVSRLPNLPNRLAPVALNLPAARGEMLPKSASPQILDADKSRIKATFFKAPLTFEANQGQTDSQVKFLARGNGYALFLTATEAVMVLRKP